jgi:hypothetical protein
MYYNQCKPKPIRSTYNGGVHPSAHQVSSHVVLYSAWKKKKNINTKKNVEEKGEKVRRYQVHIFEENKLVAEVIWKRRSESGD